MIAFDQEATRRYQEFVLEMEKRCRSVNSSMRSYSLSAGRAQLESPALMVESTVYGTIDRVSVPSHPQHAKLVPLTLRYAFTEARRRINFCNRIRRVGHNDAWVKVRNLANDARAGEVAATHQLFALFRYQPTDSEILCEEEPWNVEGEFWPYGQPRIGAEGRGKIDLLLKAWEPVAPEPTPEPQGYRCSDVQYEEWQEQFYSHARTALISKDAADVEKLVTATHLPVTARLMCPSGAYCQTTIHDGQIISLDLGVYLPGYTVPLGDLILWAADIAAQEHRKEFGTLSQPLPSLREVDPLIDLTFPSFVLSSRSGETETRTQQREAFQKTLTATITNRNRR